MFSAPVAAQITINLLGGAYVDRVGGRLIMLASCWLLALAGLELVFAQGFWALFSGQLLLVLARAAFWPANWSMATDLPGGRGIQVGRPNAVTNLGQILGNDKAARGSVALSVGLMPVTDRWLALGALLLLIAGFYVLGAAAIAVAGVIAALRRWAFTPTRASQ